MNKKIAGITVEIGGDTTKLGSALKDVDKVSRATSQELKQINNALKQSPDSVVLWQQKQEVLTQSIENSEKKLRAFQEAEEQVTKQFQNQEIGAEQYRAFQRETEKAREELKYFRGELEDLKKIDASRLEQELKQINNALKQSPDSVVLWRQKQEVLTQSIENSKNKLRAFQETEEQVTKQFQNQEIGAEQYRAFQRETEKAREELKYFRGELEDLKKIDASSGINELDSQIEELGKDSENTADDVTDLGNAAEKTSDGGITALKVALGMLIADGIRRAGGELKDFTADVIKTGAEFESQMSNVKAISGATTGEFEGLTETAKKMGATTKFTASETADAFSYMAMAGWKAGEMVAGIDGILNLAAASGEDLATTSDIVTDAMTAFGLSADKANHFADVLAVASSNANTNVGMMGETFKYVAPIAGSFGYSVEDIAEAIGLMANNGIKASQAGTSLRRILSSLTGEVKLAKDSIGEVTIQTANADGSMREFSDIISDLRDNFDKMSESEKTSAAQGLVGQEAMSGFLAIMNSAPADVDKLRNAIDNCDGAAQNMAETMIDNLAGDATIFESAIDGMKISLASKFTPVLRELVQYATDKVPDLQKIIEIAFTAAEKILKEAIQDLPKLYEKSKQLLPIVTSIGTAFLSWKSAEIVGKGVVAVKQFNDVLKITNGLTSAAALGIAGIAAALIGGVGSYVYAVEKAKQAHLDDVYKDAKSESDELTDSIKDNIKALEDSKKAAQESIDTDKLHTDKIKNLKDELSGLVDANGRVKKGYEDRAKFITDELSRATGIEIEYIDGQIKKYDELKSKIDEVIEKKRAESLQSAYSSVYESAMLFNQGAGKNAADLISNVAENKDIISNLQAKARRKVEDSYKSWADFGAFTSSNLDDWGQYLSYDDIERLKAAEASISQDEQALEELKRQFQQNTSDIEAYENAVQAMYENNYTKAQRYFAKIGDLNYAAFKSSEGLVDEQKKNFSDAVNAALKVYEGSLALGDENAKKTFADTVKDITKQATDGGLSAGDMLSTGIVNKLSAIDGFDYQALLDFCDSAGITLGDALGSATAQTAAAYLAEIQDTIDNFKNSDSVGSRIIGNSLEFVYSHIPFFADGGFLSSGQGIVAEAGPELLEVMNGGVKITPLTKSAQNSPVSSVAGTTIINNEIHANIASSYDVWKLAEDLSRAENIIERSLGK